MDNAFEKDRAAYGTGAYDDATLEFLFPQLKESEDEKIRKELFESGKGLYYYDGEKTTYCGYVATEENPYDFAMSQQEKQKEQKPAEWSEEDELMRTTVIQTLERFGGRGTTGMQIDWLKSLRPQPKQEWSEEDKKKIQEILEPSYEVHCGLCRSLCPQQKVEWSEEDEVYLQDALWCVKQASKVARGENDMGACWSAERWLKSLPERFASQLKQEWSEEDERIRKDTLRSLECYRKMFTSKRVIEDINNEIFWLKSLRPSWKPSEEELVALTRAGGILRDYGHSELAKTVFMIEGKFANLDVLNKSIWKPSDEQMRALNYFIKLWGNSDDQLEYTKIFNTVKSLRNDLEELI